MNFLPENNLKAIARNSRPDWPTQMDEVILVTTCKRISNNKQTLFPYCISVVATFIFLSFAQTLGHCVNMKETQKRAEDELSMPSWPSFNLSRTSAWPATAAAADCGYQSNCSAAATLMWSKTSTNMYLS